MSESKSIKFISMTFAMQMKKEKKKKERRSRSKSPYDKHHNGYNSSGPQHNGYNSSGPQQAWGDMRASMPTYPMNGNGNTFVPWTGEPMQQPGHQQLVTAGTVFYPSVNARPYSPEPDMGYVTRNMVRVSTKI